MIYKRKMDDGRFDKNVFNYVTVEIMCSISIGYLLGFFSH